MENKLFETGQIVKDILHGFEILLFLKIDENRFRGISQYMSGNILIDQYSINHLEPLLNDENNLIFMNEDILKNIQLQIHKNGFYWLENYGLTKGIDTESTPQRVYFWHKLDTNGHKIIPIVELCINEYNMPILSNRHYPIKCVS